MKVMCQCSNLQRPSKKHMCVCVCMRRCVVSTTAEQNQSHWWKVSLFKASYRARQARSLIKTSFREKITASLSHTHSFGSNRRTRKQSYSVPICVYRDANAMYGSARTAFMRNMSQGAGLALVWTHAYSVRLEQDGQINTEREREGSKFV